MFLDSQRNPVGPSQVSTMNANEPRVRRTRPGKVGAVLASWLLALAACEGGGGGERSGGTAPPPPSDGPAVLYFAANDGVHGLEPWKTDGTAAGTVLLEDINPAGNSLYGNTAFTAFNGAVYFLAGDGVRNPQLWKSDGTAAGTSSMLVTGDPDQPIVFDSALFFATHPAPDGLWRTDGTAAGTVLVKDVRAYQGFAAVEHSIYFAGDDGAYGIEPWKSDGTAAGTVMVKDINPGASAGSAPYGFTSFNGSIYFVAYDGSHGKELWRTDGIAAGTMMVKDINPGAAESLPDYLTVFNGALYFSADDGTHGRQLWRTDGTEAGTVMVKDIVSGARGSEPSLLTVFNDALYFNARDSSWIHRLWKTDGTAAGTVIVSTAIEAPEYLTVFKNGLYFFHTNFGPNYECGLAKTDGTAAGTMTVKVLNNCSTSFPPRVLGDRLLFFAEDGVHGSEPWLSDGTEALTVMLKDVCKGSCSSEP